MRICQGFFRSRARVAAERQLASDTAAGVADLVNAKRVQERDAAIALRHQARTLGQEGGLALLAAVVLFGLAGALLGLAVEAWPSAATLRCVPEGNSPALICTPQDNGIYSGFRSSSILLVVGAVFSGIWSLFFSSISKLIAARRAKVSARQGLAGTSAVAEI